MPSSHTAIVGFTLLTQGDELPHRLSCAETATCCLLHGQIFTSSADIQVYQHDGGRRQCGQVSLGSDAMGHRGWASPCCGGGNSRRKKGGACLFGTQIGVEIVVICIIRLENNLGLSYRFVDSVNFLIDQYQGLRKRKEGEKGRGEMRKAERKGRKVLAEGGGRLNDRFASFC